MAYWPRYANNLGLLATLREQPWPIGHPRRTTVNIQLSTYPKPNAKGEQLSTLANRPRYANKS
ncbi:hypothetical protein BJP36_42620 [Moorena producens JHB]|uniref:Uncharacterized protein n=1 Tax=Moorena producens (strain JHB) TaxID=1454205 RepID=A0A9Q9SSX1_MOOP1|nr:hypothetical protein [Moorena producens]WAN69053.1 hypothetical protein BJP36_42620 [Moorena producens JHB]